jgi:hypothetical protein
MEIKIAQLMANHAKGRGIFWDMTVPMEQRVRPGFTEGLALKMELENECAAFLKLATPSEVRPSD